MALSTFANGRLWGARYGSGPPWALALHGWERDHHDFDRVLGDIDAIALDLPGFGVAPEPPGGWSTAEYARFIVPVLDELGPGPVVVIGHSFGARVAVHLASLATAAGTAPVSPSIGALVLTGAPLAPAPGRAGPRPKFGYRAGRALHRAGLVSEARMEQFRRKYGSEDYRQATEVMRAVLVKAVAETAKGAYLPIVRDWVARGGVLDLVWGERDQVAPLAGVQAALPGRDGSVATTVVTGAGHLIAGELADQLKAAALRHRPPA